MGSVWEVETSPSLSLLLSTSKREDMVAVVLLLLVAGRRWRPVDGNARGWESSQLTSFIR